MFNICDECGDIISAENHNTHNAANFQYICKWCLVNNHPYSNEAKIRQHIYWSSGGTINKNHDNTWAINKNLEDYLGEPEI